MKSKIQTPVRRRRCTSARPVYIERHGLISRHATRNQTIAHPNPKTVTYGLESFGYKANEIWNSLPNEVKTANSLNQFKTLLSKNKSNLCTCNLCKIYVADVGYLNPV